MRSVKKTTTEIFYDEKGRITKEVKTIEESVEENKKSIADIGEEIKDKKSDNDRFKKARGIPYQPEVRFDASEADTAVITHQKVLAGDHVTGQLKLPANAITSIASEVKALIDNDARNMHTNKPI